jgi:hypothetical protein
MTDRPLRSGLFAQAEYPPSMKRKPYFRLPVIASEAIC